MGTESGNDYIRMVVDENKELSGPKNRSLEDAHINAKRSRGVAVQDKFHYAV